MCVEEEDRGQSNERGVGCLVPEPKNNINMVQYIIYFGKILERSSDRKALCTPSWIPCRCVFGYAIQRYILRRRTTTSVGGKGGVDMICAASRDIFYLHEFRQQKHQQPCTDPSAVLFSSSSRIVYCLRQRISQRPRRDQQEPFLSSESWSTHGRIHLPHTFEEFRWLLFLLQVLLENFGESIRF